MTEIVLPWPPAALSPNARVHWRKRQKAAKAARLLAWASAINARWVAPSSERVHLWVDFFPPTRRMPDDDNMLARCKAYRDGIADAIGIDDRVFVSHPYVHGEPRKGGEVRIRITGQALADAALIARFGRSEAA